MVACPVVVVVVVEVGCRRRGGLSGGGGCRGAVSLSCRCGRRVVVVVGWSARWMREVKFGTSRINV